MKPSVFLTEDPQLALLQSHATIEATELFVGSVGVEPPDAQLDRLVASWREVAGGQPRRLAIRLFAEGREERRDVGGGSRIHRAAEDDGETAQTLAGSETD